MHKQKHVKDAGMYVYKYIYIQICSLGINNFKSWPPWLVFEFALSINMNISLLLQANTAKNPPFVDGVAGDTIVGFHPRVITIVIRWALQQHLWNFWKMEAMNMQGWKAMPPPETLAQGGTRGLEKQVAPAAAAGGRRKPAPPKPPMMVQPAHAWKEHEASSSCARRC